MPALDRALARLAEAGKAEMRAQGIAPARMSVLQKAHVKYDGTDAPLVIEYGTDAEIASRFAAAHRQRFGFVMPEKPLIIEAVSAEIVGSTDAAEDRIYEAPHVPSAPEAMARAKMFTGAAWREVPVFDRDALLPGQSLDGPAIVREETATTVVEPGWRATLDERRYLVLERAVPLPARVAIGTGADPVMLEIFNNLFMSIAEEMGVALQNTAYSVNIKERLDFSCALFDRTGSLDRQRAASAGASGLDGRERPDGDPLARRAAPMGAA